MGVSDHMNDEDSTSGTTKWAAVERAPWAMNAQSYIGTGDLYGNANAALNDPRSGTWTMQMPAGQDAADASYGLLPVGTRKNIDAVAKAYFPTATGESLWRKAMAGAALSTENGKPMTAFEWLSQYSAQYMDGDGNRRGGGGGSGGGGYSGPTTSVSYDMAARPDVRAIADGVAQEMLGRVVTDEELDRVMKRVRKYENRNPSVRVTDSQPGRSVGRTTAPGATNAGRQEIIEKLLAKNPDFMPFQMNHTVYDSMLAVMKQGQGIANG